MILAIAIGIPLNLLAGFLLGKFHERVEWNNFLISKGILPKTKKPESKGWIE